MRDLRWPGLGVLLAATGIGAVLRFLGRTGALLCAPDSMLQAHAVWHVLAAIGVVAFARAAYGVPTLPAHRRTDVTA